MILSPCTYNRTILELKLLCVCDGIYFGTTYNRTILELKQVEMCYHHGGHKAYNRTILELKLNLWEKLT